MFHSRLKMHLYFLTILVSLVSFSSVVNVTPVEKTTIELVLTRTSKNQKLADYRDGLFKPSVKSLPSFFTFYYNCLLNCEQRLRTLEFINFKVKYLPFQNILPILKYQYHSSFMDIESVV